MFGRRADLAEIPTLIEMAGDAASKVDLVVCPPALYLEAAVAAVRGSAVAVGAQDCSPVAEDAARTGEIGAAMLADLGVRYTIVGHSERRTFHGESDDLVRRKAVAAQSAAVTPIVCVGETLAERDAGRAAAVVAAQVAASTPEGNAALVVAYEPVWAIGGNRTPTPAEITEIHSVVRGELVARYGAAGEGVRILYGGSVNAKNAGEIFAAEGVDGALVGRACLKASDFSAIARAHPAAK